MQTKEGGKKASHNANFGQQYTASMDLYLRSKAFTISHSACGASLGAGAHHVGQSCDRPTHPSLDVCSDKSYGRNKVGATGLTRAIVRAHGEPATAVRSTGDPNCCSADSANDLHLAGESRAKR